MLGKWVSRNVLMRRLFYTALGMLFLRQWHVRSELKKIAKLNNKWDIFDAGFGFGQYTHLMSKIFPNVNIFGIDVKDEQVEDCSWFAQQLGQKNVKFEVGDLTTFQKPDSFDFALNVDVMEHVLEDEAVFRNVFASLRRGGLFLVNTPSTTDEQNKRLKEEQFSVVGEHVRIGYTEKEFREKIERAGFVIDKMKCTYGSPWGIMAWTLLQRIPMLLLTTSKLFAIIVAPWMIAVYPFAAFFMWLDVHANYKSGGGWLLIARKP